MTVTEIMAKLVDLEIVAEDRSEDGTTTTYHLESKTDPDVIGIIITIGN